MPVTAVAIARLVTPLVPIVAAQAQHHSPAQPCCTSDGNPPPLFANRLRVYLEIADRDYVSQSTSSIQYWPTYSYS